MFNRDLPLPQRDDPPEVHHSYGRRRDPVGHRVHFALALAHLFTLPLLVMPKDLTFALLVGYAILRLPHTWRTYRPLVRSWTLALLFLWAAWHATSIAWSPDPSEGAETLTTFRAVLLPLALWPVLERPGPLVTAFLGGVLTQNVMQSLEPLGILDHLGLRDTSGDGNRLGGGLHPIHTGTLCAAAMCWHGAALLTPGACSPIVSRRLLGPISARSVFASVGFLAAATGLLVSGSRGPWIAAACALPLMPIVIAARQPEARRRAVGIVVLGLVAAAAASTLASSLLRERIDDARTEWKERDPYSSVGLRLHLWAWAMEAHRSAPWFGVGAGGYKMAVRDLPSFRAVIAGRPAAEDPELFLAFVGRSHAHSTYLEVLCCTGRVGAALIAVTLLALLICAIRTRADHPYAEGTLFVLITWIVGAAFDTYHGNGHQFGLLALIVALTLTCRPAAAGGLDRGSPEKGVGRGEK